MAAGHASEKRFITICENSVIVKGHCALSCESSKKLCFSVELGESEEMFWIIQFLSYGQIHTDDMDRKCDRSNDSYWKVLSVFFHELLFIMGVSKTQTSKLQTSKTQTSKTQTPCKMIETTWMNIIATN